MENKEMNPGSGSETAEYGSPETRYRADELDLVDLMILFWEQRKLLVISVLVAAIIGITCFEIFNGSAPTVVVRSLIETRKISVADEASSIAYSKTLAWRIKIVTLPKIASAKKFEGIRSILLATGVSAIPNTNYLEIETNAPVNTINEVTDFHDQLTSRIIAEINDSLANSQNELLVNLSTLNLESERLRELTAELQRELSAEDVEHAYTSRSNRHSIDTTLEDISAEIDRMSVIHGVLKSKVQNLNPRELVVAGIVENTSSSKRLLAYATIVVVALFFGIFVVVGNSFAARVRERMASRS